MDNASSRVNDVAGPCRAADIHTDTMAPAELLTDRTLKVETFVGQSAAQVDGFTAAALIYER